MKIINLINLRFSMSRSFKTLMYAAPALALWMGDPASAREYQASVFVGNSSFAGFLDGWGEYAVFRSPSGITVSEDGDMFVADSFNNAIRAVSSAGEVVLFAGMAFDSNGDGVMDGASVDGYGLEARFYFPTASAIYQRGKVFNVYVTDAWNHTIRKIDRNRFVSTFAGSPRQYGFRDGVGTEARLDNPCGIVADSKGDIYVSEVGNHIIRKITAAGVVELFAGTVKVPGNLDGPGNVARFNEPCGLALDEAHNALIVADTKNFTIRRVSLQKRDRARVETIAGIPGVWGSDDGDALRSTFSVPYAVAFDKTGNLFVSEQATGQIRMINSKNRVRTLQLNWTGTNVPFLRYPDGLAFDKKGDLLVTDHGHNRIVRLHETSRHSLSSSEDEESEIPLEAPAAVE